MHKMDYGLKIERNTHFAWNNSSHTLTFRPALHFWCNILLHNGRKRILEFENNKTLKFFVVLVLLTHKIKIMNNYNTKVNTYVQKTHQSACTQTHQRVPKIHQKIPKKQQIALELPDCKQCTKVHKMHISDHNSQKWTNAQKCTKCTEVQKSFAWNQSHETDATTRWHFCYISAVDWYNLETKPY